MKKILIAATISLVLARTSAWAGSGFLALDAHEVASGTASHDTWTTSWGSYDRTTLGDKSIEVTVRNISRIAGKVSVTIYFVSNGTDAGNASHEFELAGQLEVRSRVAAPTTKMRTINYAALGTSEASGTAPVQTWYVIGRKEGKIFALKASSESVRLAVGKAIAAGAIK